jgi:hypothetical protein
MRAWKVEGWAEGPHEEAEWGANASLEQDGFRIDVMLRDRGNGVEVEQLRIAPSGPELPTGGLSARTARQLFKTKELLADVRAALSERARVDDTGTFQLVLDHLGEELGQRPGRRRRWSDLELAGLLAQYKQLIKTSTTPRKDLAKQLHLSDKRVRDLVARARRHVGIPAAHGRASAELSEYGQRLLDEAAKARESSGSKGGGRKQIADATPRTESAERRPKLIYSDLGAANLARDFVEAAREGRSVVRELASKWRRSESSIRRDVAQLRIDGWLTDDDQLSDQASRTLYGPQDDIADETE